MDSAAFRASIPEPGILGQTAALAFSPGSINAAGRPNYAVDVDRPRVRSLMVLEGPRSSEDLLPYPGPTSPMRVVQVPSCDVSFRTR